MSISVLGIDIGKNNFHLFGVDSDSKKVFRKKLTRKKLRGALLEERIAVPQGIGKLRAYLPKVLEDADNGLHHLVRALIHGLNEQLVALDKRIGDYDDQVQNMADNDDICRRLVTIPSIGALTATALKAAVGDPDNFKSGRHLAAWLGLVPRQYSTGGRPRLLGISKRGDSYVRTLLVHGARAVMSRLKNQNDRCKKWVDQLNSRSHSNIAAVGWRINWPASLG